MPSRATAPVPEHSEPAVDRTRPPPFDGRSPALSSHRPERAIGIVLVLVVAVIVLVVLVRPAAAPEPIGFDVAEQGVVVRVIDGDTIVVRIDGRDERLRYIGVNAPELANVERGSAAECGSLDAAETNRELVQGRSVALERDVSDRDRFGRLLRHAWVDRDGWRLVSAELAEAGAVRARSYSPDSARDAELEIAERQARSAGRGLWGSC